MEKVKSLKTTAILNRTQSKNCTGDQFVARTFDNQLVCVLVYEGVRPNAKASEKWFTVSWSGFCGWTHDSELAFNILHNASVYTLKELRKMVKQ